MPEAKLTQKAEKELTMRSSTQVRMSERLGELSADMSGGQSGGQAASGHGCVTVTSRAFKLFALKDRQGTCSLTHSGLQATSIIVHLSATYVWLSTYEMFYTYIFRISRSTVYLR